MGNIGKHLTVIATPWHGGWDLIIDDTNATSVDSLDHAEQQVRDYLDTIDPTTDHQHINTRIVFFKPISCSPRLATHSAVNLDGNRVASAS